MKKIDSCQSHGRYRTFFKLLLTVKLVLFLMCVFALQLPAKSFSQKVTIRMENASFQQIAKHLENESGYTFLYSTEHAQKISRVNLEYKDAELTRVLDETLRDSGLSYRIVDHTIVIIPLSPDAQQPVRKTVTGIVAEKGTGSSLMGVAVRVKGTSISTVTDNQGKYRITFPDAPATVLEFSFLGKQTREIAYTGQERIDVALDEDMKAIDEIVVTGYETVEVDKMAGSYSQVKKEELVFNGQNTIEEALQGKLPGVTITNDSGLLGVRQTVKVRGTSTVLGDSQPLWVVDGVPQQDPLPFDGRELNNFDASNVDIIRNFVGNAISWLNPELIEDITVLKDASATAIYGVKAANGVIVITTRRGKIGTPQISYSGNFSIGSKVTYDKMNLMNSQERVDVSREIYDRGLVASSQTKSPIGYSGAYYDYIIGKSTFEEFNARVKQLEVNNTDWFDIFFRNPLSHSHTLSVSGGNSGVTYVATIGANENKGTARGNDVNSYNASIRLSTMLWDKVMIDFSVAGSIRDTEGSTKFSPYNFASKTTRVLPAYNEDGTYHFYSKSGYNYNPLYELEHSANSNTLSTMKASMRVRYDITDNFTFESTVGYDYSSMVGESYMDEYTHYITSIRGYEFGTRLPSDVDYLQSRLPHGGEYNFENSLTRAFVIKNQLSYKLRKDDHFISMMVGQELQSTTNKGLKGQQYGYLPGRGKTFVAPPLTYDTNSGTGYAENDLAKRIPVITDNKTNLISYYASGYYSFRDIYVLNTSIRLDASNRFGAAERYLPVWSVGGVLNIHGYEWFANQGVLNTLRLRASYGFQGNVVTNAGPELICTIGAIDRTTGEYTLNAKSLPNKNLRWEKTKTVNVGLDFGLLDNRLNGKVEYYHKLGIDILRMQDIAYEYGVSVMPVNGGRIMNEGWEATLSGTPVRTEDFVWSLNFNTGKNFNKILSPMNVVKSYINAVAGNIYKEGYPIGGFWAFRFVEVNPLNGIPVFDFTGQDDPDAPLDSTLYMEYMGKRDPDFSGGLGTSLRYRNLSLSTNFSFQIGGKGFLAPLYESVGDVPAEMDNLNRDLVGRWRKPGDITDIPTIPQGGRSGIKVAGETLYWPRMYNQSNLRVVSTSFLKCNNITMSYTMPRDMISRFAKSMTMRFSVTNPFRFVSSDFRGADPEVKMGNQPVSSTYSFNLSMTF